MEKESLKKTELKNIKETLTENLRILNKQNTIESIEETNFQSNDSFIVRNFIPSKYPSSNWIHVSDEEVDVTQLDLKSYDLGKKILRQPRKILHTEIRNWILFPFQQKQTRFNSKSIQNIIKIYFEIDELYKKINTTILEINHKIDSSNTELTRVVGKADTELSKKIENISKTYSGYVHSGYAHIMEVYGGKLSDISFNLKGVPAQSQIALKMTCVDVIIDSVKCAISFMSCKFELNELNAEVVDSFKD